MKQFHTIDYLNTSIKIELKNEAQFLHQLLKCSHFIERGINTVLRQYDLKQQQFAVLDEIVRHGPISQKELADKLLYGKSNISRIIKILSNKKLIQVTTAPMDRRLTLLIETAEGDLLWKNCVRVLNRASAEFASDLSQQNVEETFTLLRKLEKSLKATQKNFKKVFPAEVLQGEIE